MRIRLRTVIYSNKVEIDHVPINVCAACGHSEVLSFVKPNLTELIHDLGTQPVKQRMDFDEYCELSRFIRQMKKKDASRGPVESVLKERVNELLDLLLLANSLGEDKWKADIQNRLSQLAILSDILVPLTSHL